MRKLYAYKTETACPVLQFIEDTDEKIRNKLLFQIEYIQDEKRPLCEPFVKCISIPKYKGMYELRAKASETMVRIIFFKKEKEIVFLHAFYKYSAKDTEKALKAGYKILKRVVDEGGNINKENVKEVRR